MAVDSDVHHNRTKTLREDIEIQSGEGSLDKPYHPSEKSDVNSRLLEIKREYGRKAILLGAMTLLTYTFHFKFHIMYHTD